MFRKIRFTKLVFKNVKKKGKKTPKHLIFLKETVHLCIPHTGKVREINIAVFKANLLYRSDLLKDSFLSPELSF